MKVILISGKAEAGKDSTFDILKNLVPESSKILRMAYGDYVKDTAKQLWGWDGQKDEKGRALLQWWGTEYVRARHPDFWAETIVRLARVIKDEVDYLVITDVRFPNEIIAWDENEFDRVTVRVKRPGHKNKLTRKQRKHISETALDDWSFDVVLIAKDLTELQNKIQKMVADKISDRVSIYADNIANQITKTLA